jgi:hypothetical protein
VNQLIKFGEGRAGNGDMIRATMEQPVQQIASAEMNGPRQYRGVGGWLLLFIVSLTIITPVFQGYIVYNEWKLYSAAPSSLLFKILAADWSMRVILIVLAIYAGISLWRVKPGAPRVAKTYLVAVFAQQVVLLMMGFWIASKVSATSENISSVIMEPLRSIIYVVIWYSYLNKSQRVAATYSDFSPSKL